MAGKRVGIIQSNYIPWKGYFDFIRSVDEFVLLDDVQFTKRDWRNRNLIKTPGGLHWLTIPVVVKGKFLQKIRETVVSDGGWAKQHWDTLRHNYAKAPAFAEGEALLRPLYEQAAAMTQLSEINALFLRAVCAFLDIRTRISWSMDYHPLHEGKSERLIGLCQSVGGTHYLSGPAAREYIDRAAFAAQGIEVSFADYSGYSPYPQLHGPFEHGVSVVDLLLNTGREAGRYLKGDVLERPAKAA